MLLFSVRFLIVIIGCSQLFTENNITPVTVVLTKFDVLPNMLWLRAVVFVAIILQTVVLAAAPVCRDVSRPARLLVVAVRTGVPFASHHMTCRDV
jgi:formate/nitrite transporter FocA (FNT family)